MKNILLTLFLIALSSGAYANTTITALPTIPSPGVVLGTSVMAIDQNSTGTLTTYQASFNTLSSFVFSAVNPVCSLSGMPTVCGSFFGFVLPQWYGGFCDSNWNSNNAFHDDGPAIQTALASGIPVYITHCKIASTVTYQGINEQMMSFSQIVPYDTNNYAQPTPGAIFIPNNVSSGSENVAISFGGWNNVALYGINAHCNFNQTGTAVIGTDHAFRSSLAFQDIKYFHAGNCGMAIGGPTNSSGVPQAVGGDNTCGNYGCDTQLQLSFFVFNNNFFGIRANFSDSHIHDGFISDEAVAISSFNQYTGGASMSDLRIEDNFTTIPTGTSSIYLTPQSGVTTGANGVIIAGGAASWDMTNIEFETNPHPDIDLEGGNVELHGGHMYDGNSGASTPFDSYVYVSPANGGTLTMDGVVTGTANGHPAYGLINGSPASQLALTNIVGAFGVTNFEWLATPLTLKVDMLGQPEQRISPFGSGNGIGTATPLSGVDLGTQGLAIGSSYGGVTASPLNGAIIQGNVGIGTTVTTGSPLSLVGLGTTAPIGTTTGAGYLCVDSAGHTYQKSTCP